MIETILCLLVWNGTAEVLDCSFYVYRLDEKSYRLIEHRFGYQNSIGITDFKDSNIYLNEAKKHHRDRWGMTAYEHEVLHAQLLLNWRYAGMPGPCWCLFHEVRQ